MAQSLILDLLGFLLCIIVHELGHLIAGKLTGWRFSSFSVLWLTLKKENGRLRLRFSPRFILGQCLMMPPDEFKDTKFYLYNAGGSIANFLLAGVLFVVFAIVLGPEYLRPGVGTIGSIPFDFIYMTIFTSLFLGFANIIPYIVPIVGVANDGRNIMELRKSQDAKLGFYLAFKQYYELAQGKKHRDFAPITVSEDADLNNYFVASMVIAEAERLIDLGENEKAREQLNRLNLKKLPGYWRKVAEKAMKKAENKEGHNCQS